MAIAKLTLPTNYFVRPCFRLCLFMNIDVLTEKRYIMFNSFLSLNEDFWRLMMSVRISSCFIIKIIISRLVWKYYPHKKENGSFTSIFLSWMFDDLRWNSVLVQRPYDHICTFQRPPATNPEPLRSDSPAAAAYNSADGATEADAPEYEPAGKTMFI